MRLDRREYCRRVRSVAKPSWLLTPLWFAGFVAFVGLRVGLEVFIWAVGKTEVKRGN